MSIEVRIASGAPVSSHSPLTPGAGADLEDRVRRTGRGEHGELRADRRRDRVDAELERVLPRRADRGRLDDEVLGELPAQFLVGHSLHSTGCGRCGQQRILSRVSFGLTFDKLLIIAVIAVFLIGPDRLPGYAAQLARLVRVAARRWPTAPKTACARRWARSSTRSTGRSSTRASTTRAASSARRCSTTRPRSDARPPPRRMRR